MNIKYNDDLFKKIAIGLTKAQEDSRKAFIVFPFCAILLTLTLLKDVFFCIKNTGKLIKRGFFDKDKEEDEEGEKSNDDGFRKLPNDDDKEEAEETTKKPEKRKARKSVVEDDNDRSKPQGA